MVVRFEGVSKVYNAGAAQITALAALDLAIAPGRFSMVIGPSGSGKTTLLNLIGCIDTPSAGRIEICGCDVGALTDRAVTEFRARNIGYIFQTFNLIPVLSAAENVAYGLLGNGISGRDRREQVAEMLDAVGLGSHRDRRPNQLSGGQRQRVAIARALIKRPKIVLADEPTANLDSQTGGAIVELMRTMQKQYQTTFIFSTHDLQLISQADETFRIRDGALVDRQLGPATQALAP
jgi:putative ABC transport system ATP-binding protein